MYCKKNFFPMCLSLYENSGNRGVHMYRQITTAAPLPAPVPAPTTILLLQTI